MIVMKFGGTSLRDAAAIETVCELVRERLGQTPVLVVSAHAGVTNSLVELAEQAPLGKANCERLFEVHRTILRDLSLDEALLDPLFEEMRDLCRGIALVGELSPRSRDYVHAFGERMSSRIVAAAMSARSIPATAVDAFELGMRTRRNGSRPQLIPDDGRIAKALAKINGSPVITGFIAKDEKGDISTLGRNGSDLSAAFLGNAISAEEIQIWTDVDGVLTADPKIVSAARRIPEMSFEEAAELANQGGKVLHPASLAPAMEKGIPVRVLNTLHPEHAGTAILKSPEDDDCIVRCIAHKRHITLVNITSSRMLAQAGFLARIFRVFEKHGISVDMVSTSEVSVSLTLDTSHEISPALPELRDFAEVSVEHEMAQLCVVGHGIRHRMGVPARVFAPLQRSGVEVRMVSIGALKVNVSLVVAAKDIEDSVRALHAEFFDA